MNFLHANALGSDTQVTNQAGTTITDLLYYPWGQVWQLVGTEADSHFAGFQQGGGGNIYNTPARSYLNGVGSWMSPDPGGLAVDDPTNPQSWNRYAYVLNNPTTSVDPLGLDGCSGSEANNPGCIEITSWAPTPPPPIDPVVVQTCDSNGVDCQLVTVPAGPGSGNGLLGFHPGGEGGGGGTPAPKPKPNIIKWPQLQSLVAQNNESSFCDDLIDCIVMKESTLDDGFNANAVPPINPATGKPMSSPRGLMQVTHPASQDLAIPNVYDQLFNPATNIQAGSAYVNIDVFQYHHGNLRQGLAAYGTGNSYADDILNCVQKLQQGDFNGAEAAAHGH